jgi:Predicted secreted acid phosphatase
MGIRPTTKGAFMLHLRPSRLLPAAAAALAAALATFTLVAPGAADAHRPPPAHAVPAPPQNPTSADQIQNIDQVRTAIKAYYGDTADPTTVDPVTGQKDLHTFSPTGAYATEMAGIVRDAQRYLTVAGRQGHHGGHATKAVLFDVDDTTLNTYSYEISSNFVYNPTSNAAFVNAGVFPAVPHMVDLVKYATAQGYTVFFLTGRPGTQQAGTLANLAGAGYPAVPASNLYLKDYTADTWLRSCAPTCTTIQYKSLTRAHIESLGYDIVASFGDQYSDLTGGYADRTFKLPNPMYYLP